MATICKMLSQANINLTTAESIYSPDRETQVIIRNIFLCNTSSLSVSYDLYHDDDGQVYLDSTAIYKKVTIAPYTTEKLDVHICMNNHLGNIGISCNTPNALTVTLYGMVI